MTAQNTTASLQPAIESITRYDADLQSAIDTLERLHVRAEEAHGEALEAQEFHKESMARIHKMFIEDALASAKRAQDFLNK